MKTKKQRRPLVHYFAREMGSNGGYMLGTVRSTGNDLDKPKLRKFDFSWDTHETFWGDRVASQDEDLWYNGVQDAIGDTINDAIDASGLRDPANDYYMVDAQVSYDEDDQGHASVTVVQLRIVASSDYDEDEAGDPKPGLPWIDIIKQP